MNRIRDYDTERENWAYPTRRDPSLDDTLGMMGKLALIAICGVIIVGCICASVDMVHTTFGSRS